jgi:hypothetical protein
MLLSDQTFITVSMLETANTIEAKIPEAAAGNTTLIATSNLVAPNPNVVHLQLHLT